MTPDWNAIRLDLLDIDAPMRATLHELRPFFAKALPGILARFYDKVRQYDPSSGIFKDGAVQEAIRLQLQHWDLIGAADFSLPYYSSIARLSEFHQRAGVAPQWYVGCRPMFIADQLIKATETEVELPSCNQAVQTAVGDKRALMQKAIAKAVMLDTENVVAVYFRSNRQIRKDTIADASTPPSDGLVGDQSGSLVATVLGLLSDHLPDLLFNLLLCGGIHRLELILGDAKLRQHGGVHALGGGHLRVFEKLLFRRFDFGQLGGQA